MKKLISIVLICTLISLIFCSCAGKALNLDSANVAKIALTSSAGGSVIVDTTDDIQTVLKALASCSYSTSNDSTQDLKMKYQFTTYNNANAPINTVTVFSNEYLQMDTVLYKGSFFNLINALTIYCNASSTTEFSNVFELNAKDITEIAFYNVTKETFKMVTRAEDIEKIHSALTGMKTDEKGTNGEITEKYKLYIREKNASEYHPVVEIIQYESGTVCQSAGKSSTVTYYNWNILYEKMYYNTMPIK